MKKYLKPSLLEIQVKAIYALMDPSPTGGQPGSPDPKDMAPARNW